MTDSAMIPALLQGGIIPTGSRVNVFSEIYWVFLILGTLVGVVVIAYMLYNAYKYRERDDAPDTVEDRPVLGEVPTGGGKGRKLFLSFAISAVIVISLVVWTYGALAYVENEPPTQGEDTMEIEVVGYQFGWEFHYPNGATTDGELRLPEDTTVVFKVTSDDVFHNFGIPELRVKVDAIPGETTTTWAQTEEPATYEAKCYELCGAGHSYMTAEVVVMEQSEFDTWYANQTAEGS